MRWFRRPKQRVVAALDDRLAEIDRRQAEIEKRLPHAPAYEAQELRTEVATLSSLRSIAAKEVASLTGKAEPEQSREMDEAAKRKAAVIDQWVREQTEVVDHHIARLEASGQHREARLWRVQRLDIRSQIERQLGG